MELVTQRNGLMSLTVFWVWLSFAVGLYAQTGSGYDHQNWELAPMLVVSPEETLTLLPTAPLPPYHTIEREGGAIIAQIPLWHALGGHILKATECEVIYRAPAQEGVYLVYWQHPDDENQRFGFFVRVKADGQGRYELPETSFQGVQGVFVPLTRAESAPVALFLVNHRKSSKPGTLQPKPPGFIDNQGNYRVDPPNEPFFPGRLPGCRNNRCDDVRQERVHVIGYSKELGTITITESLALRLEGLGISVTRGATIKVIAEITRTMYCTLIDCYRCENGQCKYVGSRVEYLVCEKVNGYLSPQWMCDAIRRWRERHPGDPPLFPDFPPCGEPITVDRNCVAGGSGECACPPPDQPAFTRRCL